MGTSLGGWVFHQYGTDLKTRVCGSCVNIPRKVIVTQMSFSIILLYALKTLSLNVVVIQSIMIDSQLM